MQYIKLPYEEGPYIDPGNFRYKVVQIPDGVSAASAYGVDTYDSLDEYLAASDLDLYAESGSVVGGWQSGSGVSAAVRAIGLIVYGLDIDHVVDSIVQRDDLVIDGLVSVGDHVLVNDDSKIYEWSGTAWSVSADLTVTTLPSLVAVDVALAARVAVLETTDASDHDPRIDALEVDVATLISNGANWDGGDVSESILMTDAGVSGVYFGAVYDDAAPHAGDWSFVRATADKSSLEVGFGTAIAWRDTATMDMLMELDVDTGVLQVPGRISTPIIWADEINADSGTLGFSVSNAQHATMVSSGFVGFGTQTPARRVDVLDASGPQMRLSDSESAWTDFRTTSVGALEISPTNEAVYFDSDILPLNTQMRSIGRLDKKWLALHTSELWVDTLVAHDTASTVGGRLLVGITTNLTRSAESGDTTIYLQHNTVAANDILRLDARSSIEFMRVLTGPFEITAGGWDGQDYTKGEYWYTVERNLDGTGADPWYEGDAVLNTGVKNSGFIDMYASTSVDGDAYGPSIRFKVRTADESDGGAYYNAWGDRVALGALRGSYDYGFETYGLAAGNQALSWVSLDDDRGFRILNGTEVVGHWDTDGSVTIGGINPLSSFYFMSGQVFRSMNTGSPFTTLNSGTPYPHMHFDEEELYFTDGVTKHLRLLSTGEIWLGPKIDGYSAFQINSTSASFWQPITGGGHREAIKLASDGSGHLANTNVRWGTAGNFVIDGQASIAGWTVAADKLESGTAGATKLTLESTATTGRIYVGIGTYGNDNTAFYFDEQGRFSLGNELTWDGSTLSIAGDVSIIADYGDLLNLPTSLADINATEGGKLTGVATGATVGASWTSNLTNIPSRMSDSDAPGVAGVYLSANYIGTSDGATWTTYFNGDGSGQLAGGKVAWDTNGNLNADAILSVGNLPGLPLDAFLVAFWNFDEGVGSTLLDQVGSSHGTLVSGVAWGSGVSGSGLVFDGTGDGVSLDSSVILVSDDAWSISYWFVQDVADKMTVGDSTAGNNYLWHDQLGDQLVMRLNTAWSATFTWSGADAVVASGWHHIVVVSDTTSYLFYVDGILIDTQANTAASTLVVDTIGNVGGASYRWDGQLDEVRIYDIALTINNVRGLYLNPQGPVGTVIIGDRISTGKITSTNWNGTTLGSRFDLDGGVLELGGAGANAKLWFDGTDLILQGEINAATGDIGGWTIGATTLTGGNIQLSSAGSIVHTGGAFSLNNDATGTLAAGNISWTAAGVITLANFSSTDGTVGGWDLSATGLGVGNISLASNGSLSHTGGKWAINDDGSGQFATSKISWDAAGNMSYDGAIIARSGIIEDAVVIGGTRADLIAQQRFAFENGAESGEFDAWTAGTGHTVVSDADAFSGTAAALISSTTAIAISSGVPDGVRVEIPANVALNFAGRRIVVRIYAKQPSTLASPLAAATYSTNGDGAKGWVNFAPTVSWAPYSFEYDVPASTTGAPTYLSVWGDKAGNGDGVLIDRILIETATRDAAGEVTVAGLYLTKEYFGYWDGAAWASEFKDDGTFSLGGGKLTWNNTKLSVTGIVSADEGDIGGWTIDSNEIYSGDIHLMPGVALFISSAGINSYGNLNTPVWLGTDGRVSLRDKFLWDGTTLTITGAVTATSGSFTGAVYASSGSFTGAVYASSGSFSGTLSGASGNFAGSITGATGAFSGTLSASNLTAGTINAGVITVSNLNASNITSGTISADKISGGSISSSSFSVGSDYWNTGGAFRFGGVTGINYSGSGNVTIGSNVLVSGDISGASGHFTGAVTATSGSFTGAIYASSGTFAGNLTGGAMTLTGNLNVTGTITNTDVRIGYSGVTFGDGVSTLSGYAQWRTSTSQFEKFAAVDRLYNYTQLGKSISYDGAGDIQFNIPIVGTPTFSAGAIFSSTTTFSAASLKIGNVNAVTGGVSLYGSGSELYKKDSAGTAYQVLHTGSSIDHDTLQNYVANQHIDWTSSTSAFSTTGTLAAGTITSTAISSGSSPFTLTTTGNTSQVTINHSTGGALATIIEWQWAGSERGHLDGVGGLYIDSTLQQSQSDARFKDNVLTVTDVAVKLRKLRGVTFTWNDSAINGMSGQDDTGMIAQEVRSVFPHAVWERTDKDEVDPYLGIYYDKVVPLLVEGWKYHDDEVAQLKSRVDELEGQIAALS